MLNQACFMVCQHFPRMMQPEESEPSEIIERVSPRNRTEAAVACQLYASHGGTQKIDGVMRNFSNNGAYIEINVPVPVGTLLIVRIVRYPSLSIGDDKEIMPRSMGLAEVRWNREAQDAQPPCYGVGLKYID